MADTYVPAIFFRWNPPPDPLPFPTENRDRSAIGCTGMCQGAAYVKVVTYVTTFFPGTDVPVPLSSHEDLQ